MARISKCKLVKELVKGKGGHVKPVLDCATTLGIPKMQVVGKIGKFCAISLHPSRTFFRSDCCLIYHLSVGGVVLCESYR